ncbi:hypothetical protein [Bordetella sp. FB-8]|uniref:hypothetical protein n=1 Tax=Bordetella sp. FB-8 TaxID=1159870 RepID=UPI00035E7826|nr:hypothetical protein [Bordetella sp. FB-8]
MKNRKIGGACGSDFRASLQATFEFLNEMEEKALNEKDFDAANLPQRLFLPGLDLGAMPNHINRSGLFAPIAKGARTFHRQATIISRSDCEIRYTGEQLDEADAEIIMVLIFFARSFHLGEYVPLQRAQVLRTLERGDGVVQYEWLHRRLNAMSEATLFVEAKNRDGSSRYKIGKSAVFRILKEFTYDPDTDTYSYVLDPRWVQLFGNREFSRLDWTKKMMISRGQDMAKTLQRLIATSSDKVQRYALDYLKAKMCYGGRMRDFRAALSRATGELYKLDIIANAQIEMNTRKEEQLVMWLPEMSET